MTLLGSVQTTTLVVVMIRNGYAPEVEKLEFGALARQRHGFPRGEAVIQIGSSEPIWMTDEERRNVPITNTVRKKGTF